MIGGGAIGILADVLCQSKPFVIPDGRRRSQRSIRNPAQEAPKARYGVFDEPHAEFRLSSPLGSSSSAGMTKWARKEALPR
jgi:hypothetical protein